MYSLKTFRSGILKTALLLLLFAGAGGLFIYGYSEFQITRQYPVPNVTITRVDTVDLAEGKRMAQIVGCLNGCHGANGEGGLEEIRGLFTKTAPTLSAELSRYNDTELIRLIRYGLKRDGSSAFGMISYTFWSIGDRDLYNIIAYLRTLPQQTAIPRKMDLSWKGRWSLVTGQWKLSVEQVDRSRPQWGNLPMPTAFEKGRYLASITCTECHGLDFEGNPIERAPNLSIIGAYSREQFHHLIRTAEPFSKRTLDDNMQWVKDAPFTDTEISAIYTFLRRQKGFDTESNNQ